MTKNKKKTKVTKMVAPVVKCDMVPGPFGISQHKKTLLVYFDVGTTARNKWDEIETEIKVKFDSVKDRYNLIFIPHKHSTYVEVFD